MKKIGLIILLIATLLTPSLLAYSTLDSEPANTDCPGVSISELENVSSYKLILADMSMNANYDGDKLSFTPAVAGTLKVSINADQPTSLRLGTTCGHQEYDYMVNKTSYEKSIEIPANGSVHIMAYNWSTGAGYDYQLDIEFTPEGGTDPVDLNDSTTDTGDTSNTGDNSNTDIPEADTNTDYTSQNFTENSAGTLTHPTLTNDVIGTTKGSFSVNQGSANYSLDISVPAGRAGMQPKISLDYNSNGGDGYLGKGWGIGGLGTISRCPSTMAIDKQVRGVKLDEDDKYCLNGQRLIKLPTNTSEGDAEYRTEIDSYSKIVSYGSNDYGPAHWKVWTKSGLVYRYGYNDDADIKVGTTASAPANTGTKGSRALSVTGEERIFSWAVDKISDRTEDGNSINFHYNNYPENERYITRIDYVGGAINFNYNREDFPNACIGWS